MTGDEEAVRLLLKAVDALPEAERQVVLEFLLARGLVAPAAAPPFVSVGSALQPPGFSGRLRQAGEQQMVPVRFPVEQHQRLREWCGEHGFAMAVVVRGLVERFLDEQGAPAPAPAD